MTPPTAILRFSDTEIVTSDPLTVQTLWRLMAHSVSPEERAAVDGRTDYQEPAVHLHATEGGG